MEPKPFGHRRFKVVDSLQDHLFCGQEMMQCSLRFVGRVSRSVLRLDEGSKPPITALFFAYPDGCVMSIPCLFI